MRMKSSRGTYLIIGTNCDTCRVLRGELRPTCAYTTHTTKRLVLFAGCSHK